MSHLQEEVCYFIPSIGNYVKPHVQRWPVRIAFLTAQNSFPVVIQGESQYLNLIGGVVGTFWKAISPPWEAAATLLAGSELAGLGVSVLVCKRAENRDTSRKGVTLHISTPCAQSTWRCACLPSTIMGSGEHSGWQEASDRWLPALAPFSFSFFHVEGRGYFSLSSFVKGSGVSESLWCFLSRGGSTLLQRVHEGERMYPPLAIIGWWEPAGKHKIRCLTLTRINMETEKSHSAGAATYSCTNTRLHLQQETSLFGYEHIFLSWSCSVVIHTYSNHPGYCYWLSPR